MAQKPSEVPVEDYGKALDSKAVQSHWWKVDEQDIYRHLFSIVEDIEKRQSYRKVTNLRHARLYSNREVLGLQAGMFSRTANDSFVNNNLTLNVVKSCIDTAASKIAKAKPRPMYLTIDGNWAAQDRAKKRTRYMDGAFEEACVYKHMQRGFTDAAIFGTGAVKFFKEDGKVKCERTIIDEILVDDADGIYGTPSQMHQTKYMSKDVLIDMFPDSADLITTCTSGLPVEVQSKFSIEVVRVVESWKLPSSKKSKDGMHAICIENATLYAKEYKRDRFPFVAQRWNNSITGYFGIGIAYELMGLQLALTKKIVTTDKAQDLMSVPRIWVENTSMVNTGAIDNDIGSIGKYTGTPPVAVTWPAMGPEIYQWIENLYRKAYEIVGISQLSANSQKPPGLNSGVAMRTYQDVESDRFQIVGQNYEAAHMEAASMIEELTEELASEGKDPYVTVKNNKKVEVLNWSDVHMKDTPYSVRCFPTSILPTQPAGKLQTVQELVQAGFIEKDMAMSLLDFPDFEAASSNLLASYNIVRKILFDMVEKNDYQSPEPYMNLPQALTMAQNFYLQSRSDDVPEERLELIRRFMLEVKDEIKQGQMPDPEAMPMPAGPEAQPQAVPMAAPQSELLPNAPGGMDAGIPS